MSDLQAKALTIDKLMQIAPAGTVDPTPFIYDSTMYTMAGLMVSVCTTSSCDVNEECGVAPILRSHCFFPNSRLKGTR